MTGFTLPVWVTAAAKGAMQMLCSGSFDLEQRLNCLDGQNVVVPISFAAPFDQGEKAIAVAHCDPGQSLDLTMDLEICVSVTFIQNSIASFQDVSEVNSDNSWLKIIPGYGVGKKIETHEISISQFAKDLLIVNLLPFRKQGSLLVVEIIFPSGRKLGERTSNHAFGVVDGLALIGTQAQVQTSASPDQLQKTIDTLRQRCSNSRPSDFLTFVIGENGLDLALKLGIPQKQIIKTGNWLGPLLVAAAQEQVRQLLVFGYHGKLIKLAGGVFHTHHHVADNRLETLIAIAVKANIPLSVIKLFENASSVEAALLILENKDILIARNLWERVSNDVEKRSADYVKRYVDSSIEVGAVMFDRNRKLRWAGLNGFRQITSLGLKVAD